MPSTPRKVKPDAIISALGNAAAAWLRGDPIADTPQRLAEFIAQCGNETGGFVRFEENLNYSAQGLAETWPTRYAINSAPKVKAPNARAIALARKPEAIANDTYALRMGNLDGAHDTDNHPDGWQYRGRGMLQLTGRANYAAFGKLLGLPLITEPDLAADPADSLVIAREFWRAGNVNAAIDRGDFLKARQITNGKDAIGLSAVAARRARMLQVLA